MSVLNLSQGKVIGEPTITEGLVFMTIRCVCGATSLLFGLPGTARQCVNSECDWDFAITGLPEVTPDGQVGWKIGFRRRPKP